MRSAAKLCWRALLAWTGAAGAQDCGAPPSGTSSSASRSRRSRRRTSSAASPAARTAGRRASGSPAGAISRAARAEPGGLHEVYFEYDDEIRIHRARQGPRPRGRALGRHHRIRLSGDRVGAVRRRAACSRASGMVTDSRPDHRNDITDADLRKRDDAYLFGGRHGVALRHRCRSAIAPRCRRPKARARSATLFVKQSCELTDASTGRKIVAARQLSSASPARAASIRNADATDPGPVRELGAGGGFRYRRPVMGSEASPRCHCRTCPTGVRHGLCFHAAFSIGAQARFARRR